MCRLDEGDGSHVAETGVGVSDTFCEQGARDYCGGLVADQLVPVDWAVRVVGEIIGKGTENEELEVYNVVYPRPVGWDLLVEVQKQQLKMEAKVVSLREWARQVRVWDDGVKDVGPTLETALRLFDLVAERGHKVEYSTGMWK
jgi:hypothetical protein